MTIAHIYNYEPASSVAAKLNTLIDLANTNDQDTYIADTNLSAMKVVRIETNGKVGYASNDELEDANLVLGITATSVIADGSVSVYKYGRVNNSAFSGFSIGDTIYVGVNGELTAIAPTAPGAAHLTIVGLITATDTLDINIRQSIILN